MWQPSRLVIALLLAAAATSIAPAPASASCAGPPSPSPYRFTGTVTSVQRGGLIASVRTDDGRDVVVRGTQADNISGVTSVDRRYTAGVRYEFHPINNHSPYEDNACTATTPIGGTPSTPDSSSGWLLGGGIATAGLLVAALVLVLRRRHRVHSGHLSSAT